MEVKNEIEKVWFIEDNELVHRNKVVSKLNYKGMEIAVLKQEIDNYGQEFLFKDINNEYWKMNILGIELKKFINDNKDNIEYCDKVYNTLLNANLNEFFAKKVERKQYFNKCELEYISRYCPSLYSRAKESREKIIEENRRNSKEQLEQREQEHQKEIIATNDFCEKRLEVIKNKIRTGQDVESEDLKFYKDNNTLTTQNCFLYLAKYYGINIPLATQGFINNRLVSYNFTTNNYSYKLVKKNNRPSEKIHEYLSEIYIKTNEEFDKQVAKLRQKVDKLRGNDNVK